MQSQVIDPAYEETEDPIERIFAIVKVYRKILRESDFRDGSVVGKVAIEVSPNHPKLRKLIVTNVEALHETIENLLQNASDRLPKKTKPTALAQFVVATLEGTLILARVSHRIESFDRAISQLKGYFSRLIQERTDAERPKEES